MFVFFSQIHAYFSIKRLSHSLSHPLPCVSLGERDRRSRRWQRHERRIDWSIQEQFHVSAHSFKSSPHPIPSRQFEGAHKCLCMCKMCVNIKRQIVSGWPRDTKWMSPSRFLFSPASLWPSLLTVCLRSLLCSLISSLGPSGAPLKVSAFPLSSYSIRPRHHYHGVCTASALWWWCMLQDSADLCCPWNLLLLLVTSACYLFLAVVVFCHFAPLRLFLFCVSFLSLTVFLNFPLIDLFLVVSYSVLTPCADCIKMWKRWGCTFD